MSSPVQESDHNTPPPPDPETTQHEPSAVATESDSDNNKSAADNTERNTFALKMLNLCREITIMILFAIVYTALTNESPPKVSKSPAAYPFFPRDSLVTDWYKGQITEAIEEARSSDIAFVMFYAPWDAESQAARKELEFAARYMHEQVTFAAVNCWQPGSECRRQYSKVYKWPVLIAYPTHGRGIQYNGPLEAFHMIKFLQNMCKPVIRPNKLDDLKGKYDTVVSANISALPGSYEYAVFYSTALRFLERDPFRDTVFAIQPQNYDSVPSIIIHNWNATIEYDGELSPEALSLWILKNSHQVNGWVAPSGMKSLTLAGFMQPGPTLILFTPKNPLLAENDYYYMLREIAYEYHNCANKTLVTKNIQLLREQRAKNKENYHKLKEKCLNRHTATRKPVITNLSNIWTNTSMKDICNCFTNERLHSFCAHSDTSVLTTDKLSSNHLQETMADEECRGLLLAEKYAPPIFEKSVKSGINVTGLACASNSTLRFVAVDTLRFYQFAERLGVDLAHSRDRSGVVVVNEKMETHHVMAANVSSKNLRSFVYNFTQKSLSRSLRSKIHIKSKSNHIYPHLNCSKSDLFCVREMTSENFLSTILQTNKVVVVFYYSKQCSFCNGISYVFLTVAKMLAAVEDIIFARIDGESNLLPWEYTMDSYPTILFLPAKGKSESRTFSKNIPITVPNLMGFILTNIEPVLKLKTMWSICCQTKFLDEKDTCMVSLRMETLTVIGRTLKEWRISPQKHKVLYKLQILRHLHLLFAHSPGETTKINNYFKKLRI